MIGSADSSHLMNPRQSNARTAPVLFILSLSCVPAAKRHRDCSAKARSKGKRFFAFSAACEHLATYEFRYGHQRTRDCPLRDDSSQESCPVWPEPLLRP